LHFDFLHSYLYYATPILVGDHTPWPRKEAPTLRDRTYEHGAKVISGKPITLGHGYSSLAWILESQRSWALPLRHERISFHETPISRAVLQLKQVCRHREHPRYVMSINADG
jgi:hypothetical protein